jgi:hypothetical protein
VVLNGKPQLLFFKGKREKLGKTTTGLFKPAKPAAMKEEPLVIQTTSLINYSTNQNLNPFYFLKYL